MAFRGQAPIKELSSEEEQDEVTFSTQYFVDQGGSAAQQTSSEASCDENEVMRIFG